MKRLRIADWLELEKTENTEGKDLLMGLFTPGYLKNYDKASKTVRETTDPKVLVRIVQETQFEEKQSITLCHEAVGSLKRLDVSNEKAAALKELAFNGKTAFIRCDAGHSLGGDEGKKAVTDNIAEAYKIQGNMRMRGTAEWIDDVTDPEVQKQAYLAVKEGDLRDKILERVKNNKLRIYVIMNSDNRFTAELAMKGLGGTQSEYLDIAKNSPHEACRIMAMRRMDASQAEFLESMAASGNRVAKERLDKIDLAKYGPMYTEVIESADKKKAIEAGIFSEEALEKIATEYDDVLQQSVSVAAMRKITDKERLERLLYRPIPKGALKQNAYGVPDQNGSWVSWVCEILEKIAGDEKAALAYIQSTHDQHQPKAEGLALESVKSRGGLLQVAMNENSVAVEAAKRLGDEDLSKLRESKSRKVREWADMRWTEIKISDSNADDAFEIMRITVKQKSEPERFMKAYRSLESQEMKLQAFDEYAEAFEPFGKESLYIRNKMLSEITDAEGYFEWCLKNYKGFYGSDAVRLHELIGGSEIEKRLIDMAVTDVTENPLSALKYMRLLADSLGMKQEDALWKYAGEKYVEALMDIVENDKEYGVVINAADRLRKLYNAVPESHGAIAPHKGGKFIKHEDHYDEHCMGNSYSRETEYTFTV